jgi:hypothetical protein
MSVTTNQIIAMCFPLLTVAVAWGMAFYVKWSIKMNRQRRRHATPTATASAADVPVDFSVVEALEEADRLIREVKSHLPPRRSRTSVTQ